ncbi:MAG: hypothetical protein KDC18_12900 [Alphaproteobacteria bacterium]|nr:hypothetical protein [Alphaproteobacteria bacterium]MCB9929556.1 hypothetical protein [Alphaproteobacteria bacterium]
MLNARFSAWLEPFCARLGVMVGLWALLAAVVGIALCVADPQSASSGPAVAGTLVQDDQPDG